MERNREQLSLGTVRALIDSATAASEFAQVDVAVEALFRELGASVLNGPRSDDGTPDVRLYIPPEQSAYGRALINRPA